MLTHWVLNSYVGRGLRVQLSLEPVPVSEALALFSVTVGKCLYSGIGKFPKQCQVSGNVAEA